MSVEIVAELSNNWLVQGGEHETDRERRDRMGRLIDAAKACGADAVKLQCYLPDELVALRGNGPAPEPWGSQGYDMRSLYTLAATPFDWFPHIKAHCERVGMPWFSSVFGKDSLALLESLDCPRYKIASFERKRRDLFKAVIKTHKKIYASAPDFYDRDQRYLRPLWLFCPPGYPTKPSDVKLPYLFYCGYDGAEDTFHGCSFHCLAPELPIAAVARGARLLEYHFQLDAEPSLLESHVSLNETAFKQMVESVRRTEELLG